MFLHDALSRRPRALVPAMAPAMALALGLALGRAAVAQGAAPVEPPALPYPAAVAARFPAPAVVYDTPGLRPGRVELTRNDELAAALQAITARSSARLLTVTHTDTGERVLALRFSRGPGRPVVLLVGQQHGNEPAGAEALLVIAERLANPASDLAAVLDRLDVVVLPRANPDGRLLGRRGNALNLDINRDHLQLETAEAQGLAALTRELRPVLWVDVHEFVAVSRTLARHGLLKRPDLMVQVATTPNLPPALGAAGEAWFLAPMREALDREGLRSDWYHLNPGPGTPLRLDMGGIGPGLARNAGGLHHAVSVLLESRGLDLGRAHIQRRVHSHVVAVSSLLHSAARHAADLQQLRDDADAAVAARACMGEVVLEAALTPERREMRFLDAVTGADRRLTLDWGSALALQPLRQRPRPCGYWLAAGATEAVDRLRQLGVQVQPWSSDAALQVERYAERPPDPTRAAGFAAVADAETFSAHVVVELRPQSFSPPAGGYYVSLAQPLANLAVVALEPDTPDSYYTRHLLPRLDDVLRVTAPPR